MVMQLDLDAFALTSSWRVGFPFGDWLFWLVSLSVSAIFIFAIFYYWFFAKDKKTAIKTGIGFLALYGLVEILKLLFESARPDLSDNFSFPSRHTALAFFLAFAMPVERKYKILLIAWALLVSFSRLWLGVHWLTDVLAGALIGVIGGYLTLKLEIKKSDFRH